MSMNISGISTASSGVVSSPKQSPSGKSAISKNPGSLFSEPPGAYYVDDSFKIARPLPTNPPSAAPGTKVPAYFNLPAVSTGTQNVRFMNLTRKH
jgi:hypothetical protein